MKNIKISNYEDLTLRIMFLKEQKIDQEKELRRSFNEIAHRINPVTIVKDSIMELAQDKEVQYGLTSVGLNMGVNLIIEKVLGKNKSVKGFFSSMLVEALARPLIDKSIPNIVSGISKLIHPHSKVETEE